VAGVWVSNHGGRQLDTVRAAVDILPEVVHVLAGSNIEIYVDGGIRRGNDIFKCLALGAKCVFVGRPVLYSAAIGGKQGTA
jgi:(S)-2-hydroxy-acid oxidase